MKTLNLGFYYHYKHDPNTGWNDYLYEVTTLAEHTEMENSDESSLVIYRPLYQAGVYKNGKHSYARPLAMFLETVEKDGVTKNRFEQVTDPKLIEKCKILAQEMYG